MRLKRTLGVVLFLLGTLGCGSVDTDVAEYCARTSRCVCDGGTDGCCIPLGQPCGHPGDYPCCQGTCSGPLNAQICTGAPPDGT